MVSFGALSILLTWLLEESFFIEREYSFPNENVLGLLWLIKINQQRNSIHPSIIFVSFIISIIFSLNSKDVLTNQHLYIYALKVGDHCKTRICEIGKFFFNSIGFTDQFALDRWKVFIKMKSELFTIIITIILIFCINEFRY